jgi:predicted SAM-dependent methyltransferase
MKLDLGAGARSPEGFTPLGNAHGTPIYPLANIPDASVDCVRASHVLEHFPHAEIADVLKEWTRALKPGGELKIAVPDFQRIAEGYLAGANMPTENFVMGGQIDAADYHKALFDQQSLKRALASAGLMLIRDWKSELVDDCASLPISLNLSGTKPSQSEIAVSAVMSVPRLGFMDNFFAAFEALPQLRIKLRRHTGAYWGQCIERVIEQTIAEDNPDAILALDYDSVYSRRDVSMLMQLMCCHPEADAIAPVQSHRTIPLPLFTVKDESGRHNLAGVSSQAFAGDLFRASTAHFGLTLIRADKLKALPKPWFQDVPAPDGSWNEGHIDADIKFWRKWEEAGNSLFIANRVAVGHMELMVRWPGHDLTAIYQNTSEWRETGKPEGVWQ